MKNQKLFLVALLTAYILILTWTGISTMDRFTWFLEVIPAILGISLLAFYYPRFKFTNLTYFSVFVYYVVMAWGGEYTYAQNPLFNHIKELLNLHRNYYDRVGHFLQGFVPALIAREVIIGNKLAKSRVWASFFTVTVCLAASVFYEFFEWVGRDRNGNRGRGISRNAGRCLGYAMGYVHGSYRIAGCAGLLRSLAGQADKEQACQLICR
jgi:putative membrane protein